MGNIIDYIREYGTYSLLERPFSDEDSLVIAQFSYLKLERVLMENGEGHSGVTVGAIRHSDRFEELFADTRFAEDNYALFEAMRTSRRFQTMQVADCAYRLDRTEPSQFFACTCLLEDGSVCIVFRGTDETLAGWKEDCYLSSREPVTSQKLSAAYLDRAAGRWEGTLLVGGHSKGGNLAVYGAMHCQAQVRQRIRQIYSLDGPGVLPCHRDAVTYPEIRGRIRKIVPHSSLVGMLFEDSGTYTVVESNTFGLLQHNPFSWIVRDGRFVTVRDIYRGRKAAVEVLNRWIETMGLAEQEALTKELFAILDAAEVETLLDFSGNWAQTARRMARALRDTDGQMAGELRRAWGLLLAAGKEVAGAYRGTQTADGCTGENHKME